MICDNMSAGSYLCATENVFSRVGLFTPSSGYERQTRSGLVRLRSGIELTCDADV